MEKERGNRKIGKFLTTSKRYPISGRIPMSCFPIDLNGLTRGEVKRQELASGWIELGSTDSGARWERWGDRAGIKMKKMA
jgi:hypothetical protein